MIFYFQATDLSDKHTGLKLLFNLVSLWILLLGSWIGVEMAEHDGLSSDTIFNMNTLFWLILTVVVFVTIYWIVIYLKDVLIGMSKRKKQKFLDNDEVS